MGRLSSAIGFALGTGISTGISEKRRQDAQDKHDRDLASAALDRIAKQQQNRLEAQQSQDAINDFNRLQIQHEQDALWRGVLEARGVNTKNLPGLITQQSAAVTLEELNRKESADRASKESIATQSANVNLIKMVTDATKESSPGGKTITGEEKQEIVSVGNSLERVKEAIGLVVGKPEKEGKSVEQVRYETALAVSKVNFNPSKEALVELESARTAFLQSLKDPIATDINSFQLAIAAYLEAGVPRSQAYDRLTSKFGADAVVSALGEKDDFIGGVVPEPVEKAVGFFENVGNILTGIRESGREKARLREEEKTAAATPQRRKGVLEELTPLPDANIKPSLSGLGTSLLPLPITTPPSSTRVRRDTTLTKLGRRKKNR